MINRESRAKIAQETLDILAAGSYVNRRGDTVSIARALALAKDGTVHYTGAQLDVLRSATMVGQHHATDIEVSNESSLAAISRLAREGHDDILCLNFASAKNPGGGFLGGSEAQEENLAKSSGLYACIVQKMELYEANRNLHTSMYLDDMIYSPSVPVFRDDTYAFLDQPLAASFISAPAVNRGALVRNEPERLDEVEFVMQRRIEMLLALALHRGHSTLVLGAWGCGVFAHRADQMAGWFAKCLVHNPVYRGAFARICFAVLDRKNDGTFAAFARTLGTGKA
ncbi:TIGR02452 family protein [Massilia sp. CF038]|uniref:TIGR02452 family protein n=1 Tax=Massilia sp. CF038 TaxID=1881045 RepID=UPI00091E8D18|nr:TIGR02452 family protein [Massilia sp. CF038]SHH20598.1 TIGR02452 family protein [Massilia sp. CF038]